MRESSPSFSSKTYFSFFYRQRYVFPLLEFITHIMKRKHTLCLPKSYYTWHGMRHKAAVSCQAAASYATKAVTYMPETHIHASVNESTPFHGHATH